MEWQLHRVHETGTTDSHSTGSLSGRYSAGSPVGRTVSAQAVYYDVQLHCQ